MSKFHSKGCLTTLPNCQMKDLDDLEQLYILKCPHDAHDSVRLMFGFKEKLEHSKLVRKM